MFFPGYEVVKCHITSWLDGVHLLNIITHIMFTCHTLMTNASLFVNYLICARHMRIVLSVLKHLLITFGQIIDEIVNPHSVQPLLFYEGIHLQHTALCNFPSWGIQDAP